MRLNWLSFFLYLFFCDFTFHVRKLLIDVIKGTFKDLHKVITVNITDDWPSFQSYQETSHKAHEVEVHLRKLSFYLGHMTPLNQE